MEEKIAFSSSTTVYGDPQELPISETAKLHTTNSYEFTKLFIENILNDVYRELPHLNIFGSDYDTPDGTGVRDYIHVVDLTLGHIKVLEIKTTAITLVLCTGLR